MLSKGADGQKAAVDEYFKHWDNKAAKDETPEIREVRSWTLTSCNWPHTDPLNRPEEPSTLP